MSILPICPKLAKPIFDQKVNKVGNTEWVEKAKGGLNKQNKLHKLNFWLLF